MLPTKFRFIWKSCFRGEDCYKLTNQKQELPVAAIFVNGSGRNKFWFIWTSSFREEDFYKLTNQKQELPVVAIFVNGSGRNEQSS